MTPLAAAVLLLQIVKLGLEIRLMQYEVNKELLKLDAEVAKDLAEVTKTVVVAAVKVGEAISKGVDNLLDG